MHSNLSELDESIQSGRKGRRVVEMAEQYFKKYKKQMEQLESHSLLSAVRGLNPYDYYCLGSQLESFNEYMDICEAEGTLNQLGPLPDVASL